MFFSVDGFLQALILSLVVGTVSMTISETKIFKPLREFMEKKNRRLGELVRCPYCTSHWVSLFFVILYHPKIIDKIFPVDYAVTLFTIVALATFWSMIISHFFTSIDSLSEKNTAG